MAVHHCGALSVECGIVIAARGLTSFNTSLFEALAHRPLAVVDSSSSKALRTFISTIPGACYIDAPTEPFSLSRTLNVGAAAIQFDALIFLHDDVELPQGCMWLDALLATLECEDVGLAVPRLTGDCPNNGQALDWEPECPWFDTTEFISGSVIAVRRKTFYELGGFRHQVPESDWCAIDLQRRAVMASYHIAVVPSALLHHDGGRTANRAKQMERRSANMCAYCDANGIQHEYRTRPQEVRIAAPCNSTLALIADGNAERISRRLEAAEAAIKTGLADYDEVVVIDERGTGDVWHVAQTSTIPWMFQPRIEERLEHQAANLAAGRYLRIEDLRDDPQIDSAEGRRIRAGHFYSLPQHIDEIHMAMLDGCGVGDGFMFTPAVSAFKRRWPHIRIIWHHAWESADIFRHNPDVDEVRHYNPRQTPPPPEIVHFGAGVGTEGTIRSAFDHLGISDMADGDRRLRYYLQRDEHRDACERLRSLGYTDGPVIGVQTHGGWEAKNWGRLEEFIELMSQYAWVLALGTARDRVGTIIPNPKVLELIGQTTLRQVVAMLSLLDAYVGFDSGLTYGACAVGTPIVALFGPHDARQLLIDSGAPNITVIRKREPAKCLADYGNSCRHNGNVGNRCPLREGTGADCIDETTPQEVVAELEKLPKWGVPIEERFRHALF